MTISVFDIFKIGVGPSSSHTVGPMKAALKFARLLAAKGLLSRVNRIQVDLHGSLGATGQGHGSDRAILLGLEGDMPDRVNIELVEGHLQQIRSTHSLWLLRQQAISFDLKRDLLFHWKPLPFHPNGAAGVVPAVLHYYRRCCPEASDEGVVRFLLVAGAIAMLYKQNASISGADVGCQGEVGVACSMAAGALAEVLGGTSAQVENAAEIGMEHNLGLTCDPVGGLVQVPCIERNAMGAVKAINAARMALRGDGQHRVHLDRVIKTMRDTGADMHEKYKETSRGGLAVNVIEC